MRCPYCNSDNTRVVDSRPVEEDNSIRRRRICDHCKRRFTTYERVETITIMVVKKDKRREPYSREKIYNGVVTACRKRNISVKEMNDLVDSVENEIYNREDKEITSEEIGNMVMDKLKDLDQVAYVRFASVYREFKDVNTFMDELQKLLQK
ncbi:MAG: transcriptional regulator NrdR [Eubacteriales bacterium]